MRQTVCVDFDGVLNNYTGWRGTHELFQPRPGVEAFLEALRNQYNVVIHTTRPPAAVWSWLNRYNLQGYISRVTATKPPAVVYIDDRALTFNGDFADTLQALGTFKAHWE